MPVHDVGRLDDGRAFAAMKLVRGVSLASLLGDAGPADPHLLAERRRLFLKILEAVGLAHSRGVVHCDLKPANVMVGAFGEVLVMDWDSPRQALLPVPPRSPDVGTPANMAPEQERGDRASLDARADVFALGTILLDLLRGLGRQPALQAIAERARAAAARDRYANVAELAAEIEHLPGPGGRQRVPRTTDRSGCAAGTRATRCRSCWWPPISCCESCSPSGPEVDEFKGDRVRRARVSTTRRKHS